MIFPYCHITYMFYKRTIRNMIIPPLILPKSIQQDSAYFIYQLSNYIIAEYPKMLPSCIGLGVDRMCP